MMLLTLPMAAPALIPAGSELRWADAPVLNHVVRPGETMARIAARGLQEADDIAALAEANGMAPGMRLRTGQVIEVPGALLKRDMLSAELTGFAGSAPLQGGEPLSVGMKLHEGDIIETGPNSFVSLKAAGKRLTLPSSSRVKIAALHRVVLSGEVVRTFSLLPTRNDWLAQIGLRGEDAGTMLALADSRDGQFSATARE
jgi:hypothetical protein